MDMVNLTAEDLFFQQCTAPGGPPSGRIDNCPGDEFTECFAREPSQCDGVSYIIARREPSSYYRLR